MLNLMSNPEPPDPDGFFSSHASTGDPADTCPSSESNGAGGGEVGWKGGPGDLGKPSVDQSFWERALIWI